MGILASKMPADAYPLNDVMSLVQWVYSQDYKTDKGERAECSENATSTLGKCIYSLGGNLSTDIVAQGFLDKLPLMTDVEEATPTHALLFKQIIAQNPNLCKAELLPSL